MLKRFIENSRSVLETDPQYFWNRFILNKPNPIHAWKDDAVFQDIFQKINNFTLVDEARCYVLYQLALQAKNLQGGIAEIGVYKGGTANLLAHIYAATGKPIHLFDTFAGMPAVDAKNDWMREGSLSETSLEMVQVYLHEFQHVKFYHGIFPATAAPIENDRFCFVHVDVDIYKSVLDCCTFFYPRMEKGGIIVFDDYGFLSCPGAKKAVDEFFADKQERACYLPTGQCIFIKQ